MYSRLQYISQGNTSSAQLHNIQQALDAGCIWIQLRFKNAGDKELKEVGLQVRRLCSDYKAVFILNDHPHLAREADADGVHLGLSDMQIANARAILGPNKIIGGTANTLEDVLQRVAEGCNYIGLGPFRFTQTKEKLSPVLGIEGYERIMDAITKQQINIPIYAIGGIELGDTASIIASGVYGLAVSGAITAHADKKTLVQQFNASLYGTTNNSR